MIDILNIISMNVDDISILLSSLFIVISMCIVGFIVERNKLYPFIVLVCFIAIYIGGIVTIFNDNLDSCMIKLKSQKDIKENINKIRNENNLLSKICIAIDLLQKENTQLKKENKSIKERR